MAIAIVGEAWGKDEDEAKRPFVGASGRLLNRLLANAKIDRNECLVTNVFNLRPQPTNDVGNLCGTKDQGIPGKKPLQPGKYVLRQYGSELERLDSELTAFKPNLIIALGSTALWALTEHTAIKANRGTIIPSRLGFKLLPTYHPAAMMRQWSLEPIIQADLLKARRESLFPEIRRPEREIWIEPSLEDIDRFIEEHIIPSPILSVDIETAREQITEIGFAPSTTHALVIPFLDRSKPDGNYWPSHKEEIFAWSKVREILSIGKDIVGQNFLYDMNFTWRTVGIPMPNHHDTMLLHHALQPEMEKSLGFLGSVYTDEASWKLMRRTTTNKRED